MSVPSASAPIPSGKATQGDRLVRPARTALCTRWDGLSALPPTLFDRPPLLHRLGPLGVSLDMVFMFRACLRHGSMARGRRGVGGSRNAGWYTAAMAGSRKVGPFAGLGHRTLLRGWRYLPLWARRIAVRVLYPLFPVGAVAVIRDAEGGVLLVRQTYHRQEQWGAPAAGRRAASRRATPRRARRSRRSVCGWRSSGFWPSAAAPTARSAWLSSVGL